MTTTSRIVRGTKTRFFLYICAVLIITGVIACYNNTLSQLEDARKSSEICHQQEENLSTQLQVISDYKQRLEKSLKTEKAEHQQTKIDLENKLNQERTKNEKKDNEANLRFTSLQQQFNILQTQYEDFQTKLKQIQDELTEAKTSKESLKSKYLELQTKNEQLQEKNDELQKLIDRKEKDNENEQSNINHLTKINTELRNELEDIKRKYPAYESNQIHVVSPESLIANNEQKLDKSSVKINDQRKNNDKKGINVELDSYKQVAQPSQNFIKTPSKSTTTSNLKSSQGSLNGARPLKIPTVTPKGANKMSRSSKKVPNGVVPVPEKRDSEKKTEEEKNDLPNEALNNRYRNKISDIALKDNNRKNDEVDKENVANEIFDQRNAYDNFGFGEANEIKNIGKQNLAKNHIDRLGIDGNKIYNNYENPQLEENEPEDDDPDYVDRIGRNKDPAIRN